jgi:hypothetical protein
VAIIIRLNMGTEATIIIRLNILTKVANVIRLNIRTEVANNWTEHTDTSGDYN